MAALCAWLSISFMDFDDCICELRILRDASTSSFSRLHSFNRTMVVRHLTCSIIFEGHVGTIPLGVHTSRELWGALFFSVIALSHYPHTIVLPLQYWCGSTPTPSIFVCNSSYLLGQHISVSQSSYLFFATPTLSPRTPLSFAFSSSRLCQVIGFHGGLFFVSLSQNPWTLWNVDITLCS